MCFSISAWLLKKCQDRFSPKCTGHFYLSLLVVQSRLALCTPGIEPRGSSWPRDWTWVSCTNVLINMVVSIPTCHAGDRGSIPRWGGNTPSGASLVARLVKNLPAVQETWVWSLGWEDPLGKEMATHSSIIAWKISWTEEPGELQSMGLQRGGHDWATNTNTPALQADSLPVWDTREGLLINLPCPSGSSPLWDIVPLSSPLKSVVR